MAGTTSDKLALLRQIKEAFRAAITGKGQTISDDEPYSAWPAKVSAIETGIQLPTLTNPGGAADLRQGKQLIDQAGQIVDGTLEEVQQATPSISVSSAGLITATAGDKSATKQLSTQAGGTRTPGTSDAIIAYSGQYATGNITMKGDANLVPENIKSGVSIFGVNGTLAGGITVIEFTKSDFSMEYHDDGYTKFTITLPNITTASTILGFGAYIKTDNTGNGWFIFGPLPYSNRPIGIAETNGNATVEKCTLTPGNGSVVLEGDCGSVYGFLEEEGLTDPSDWRDAGGWITFM